MDFELSESQFKNIKSKILQARDISLKGSIDEQILGLIQKINSHNDFVTTSSCSGRIVVVSKDNGQKKGCKTVFTSHGEVNEKEFLESIQNETCNLIVNFQPFILHIQCRTLRHAKFISTCAYQSGCKNSGIVLGKRGKITVAVRNCLNLEVPITSMGQLLVTEKYLKFLINEVNQKMKRNEEIIVKFDETFSRLLP